MDQNIPSFVSQYNPNENPNHSQSNGRISPTIDCQINPTEECLQRWFKCTKFNGCYFTCEDINNFRTHLRERHPNHQFFCIYCNRICDEVFIRFKHYNN